MRTMFDPSMRIFDVNFMKEKKMTVYIANGGETPILRLEPPRVTFPDEMMPKRLARIILERVTGFASKNFRAAVSDQLTEFEIVFPTSLGPAHRFQGHVVSVLTGTYGDTVTIQPTHIHLDSDDGHPISLNDFRYKYCINPPIVVGVNRDSSSPDFGQLVYAKEQKDMAPTNEKGKRLRRQ